MKKSLSSITLLLFTFLFSILGTIGCTPGQILTVATATATPIQNTNTPTLTFTPFPTTTPTATPILESPLGQFLSIPGVEHDVNGYHISLSDSRRTIDISDSSAEKQIVFDSEYNIFKIFDSEGNISSEFDAGQGVEGDTDYVPATGWVDIQKLSKDLLCRLGNGISCMNENTDEGFSDSIWFEFKSTGVFRYKVIEDENTGKSLGKILIMQIASRDLIQNPVSAWMVVQVESSSTPGSNILRAVAQGRFMDEGKDVNFDDGKIILIDQWKKWFPEGYGSAYSFMKMGRSYLDLLKDKTKKTTDEIAADFISSEGIANSSLDVILSANGRSYNKNLPPQ